jgi:hypothetical protein
VAVSGDLNWHVSEGMTHVEKVPDAPNIAVEATISAEVSREEQV